MDNATAEYSFVSSFFAPETSTSPFSSKEKTNSLLSPVDGGFDEQYSLIGQETVRHTSKAYTDSIVNTTPKQSTVVKTERVPLDAIWKQIMDPVLEYCRVCSIQVLRYLNALAQMCGARFSCSLLSILSRRLSLSSL
jgi:vacuolar protein sorting-associated protein 52